MLDWQSIDHFFKIAVPIVGGIGAVVSVQKAYLEISLALRSRRWEEYRFAKEFLNDLHEEKALHPFLRKKGCQTVTGDKNANRYHVECLLSLDEPGVALRQYSSGKKYVELARVENASASFLFRKKYKNKLARKAIKLWWFIVYALLIMALEFMPEWVKAIFHDVTWRFVIASIWFFVKLSLAFYFLNFVSRINDAEKLVRSFRTTD